MGINEAHLRLPVRSGPAMLESSQAHVAALVRHTQGGVMLEALPTAALVMGKTKLVLEFLIVTSAPP